MSGCVIDSCSLLNLYTGWRGLSELKQLDINWYIPDAVAAESQFSRERGNDGNFSVNSIDVEKFIDEGIFIRVRPEGPLEIEDYVNFAAEIDDGEAQAIAIAKNRKLQFLSDDAKAVRLCLGVAEKTEVVSTPRILNTWSLLAEGNIGRIPSVIRRIEELARFSPKAGSPWYSWWKEQANRP